MSALISTTNTMKTPSAETMALCFKLSLDEDKPILTDYWEASVSKEAFIGIRGNGNNKVQLLVKSDDEYTSPIVKIRKLNNDYVVTTENSIYLVSIEIPIKQIA